MENGVYEFGLCMRSTGSGCGQNDYQTNKCQVYDADEMSNFEMEIQEGLKKTKRRRRGLTFLLSFCKLKQAHTRVNMRR